MDSSIGSKLLPEEVESGSFYLVQAKIAVFVRVTLLGCFLGEIIFR